MFIVMLHDPIAKVACEINIGQLVVKGELVNDRR